MPDEPPGSFTVTQGENLGETLDRSQEALELTLIGMIEDEAEIPGTSKPEIREEMVALTPYFAAKMALALEMRWQQMEPEELRRRMGIGETHLRKPLDPWEISGMKRLTQALQSLGRRIVLEDMLEDMPEDRGRHFHEPGWPVQRPGAGRHAGPPRDTGDGVLRPEFRSRTPDP